jgi:hypothetical protein
MSKVKLEIQLSLPELIKAAEQLNQPELEQFVSKLIILYNQRKSNRLLTGEAELCLTNHQETAYEIHNHYHQVMTTTEDKMTEDEYRELLRLSEQIDKLQAYRFEYIANLANLHNVSLTELMRSLGFQT